MIRSTYIKIVECGEVVRTGVDHHWQAMFVCKRRSIIFSTKLYGQAFDLQCVGCFHDWFQIIQHFELKLKFGEICWYWKCKQLATFTSCRPKKYPFAYSTSSSALLAPLVDRPRWELRTSLKISCLNPSFFIKMAYFWSSLSYILRNEVSNIIWEVSSVNIWSFLFYLRWVNFQMNLQIKFQ